MNAAAKPSKGFLDRYARTRDAVTQSVSESLMSAPNAALWELNTFDSDNSLARISGIQLPAPLLGNFEVCYDLGSQQIEKIKMRDYRY
jgi:hypothetical protein